MSSRFARIGLPGKPNLIRFEQSFLRKRQDGAAVGASAGRWAALPFLPGAPCFIVDYSSVATGCPEDDPSTAAWASNEDLSGNQARLRAHRTEIAII
jgi:hypothetical protein